MKRRMLLRSALPAAWAARITWTTLAAGLPAAAWAHGTRAGQVRVDHPYAPPSTPGQARAPVYLRAVQNSGPAVERIVGAHTGRATQVRLPRGPVELPPGQALRLGHDGPAPFELVDPVPPLRDGERFTLTLTFERAGPVDVEVWVQTPRTRRP